MQVCIFPSRFQPFHNGQLMVIQGMMKACGNATIVICEAHKKDADDPFSVDERREMISAALLSADIMDATIVTVKDGEDDAAWVTHVLDAAGNPSDALVWSGNEQVRKLFEAHGVATKKVVSVPGIDAKEIRDMIEQRDGNWRKKVPAGALDVIENILTKQN